jgi:alanine-synthesizing transaminase
MWVLLGPGDAALVPSPSYPIHIWGPIFAGAEVRYVRLGPEEDFFANLMNEWEESWPRPRVIVLAFPHNPTTACVDLDFMTRSSSRGSRCAACPRLRLRRSGLRRAPTRRRIPQAPGATDAPLRAVHAHEVVSGGMADGILVGNEQVVAALASRRATSTTAPSSPFRSLIVAMNEAPHYPLR